MKSFIKRLFGLRSDLSFSFYFIDFIFRRLLRQNAGIKYAVHHSSTIRCPNHLKLGKKAWPGDSPNVYINAINGVEIGDFTNIGPNVSIISANHDFINNEAQIIAEGIKIGAFCWLASGCFILPEIRLGDFTIVGAGAVVTKSFEEGYCVIAGNPAKIIKQLDKDACLKFKASKK